jgi:hypothetical protein
LVTSTSRLQHCQMERRCDLWLEKSQSDPVQLVKHRHCAQKWPSQGF